MARAQRFLVKMRAPGGAASLQLSGTTVGLSVRPLFERIGRPAGLGVDAGAAWHIVEPPLGLDIGHPWDACHALVSQGLGLDGAAAPEFAEPDFEQSWSTGSPRDEEIALTASCQPVPQKTGSDGYPGDPDPLWHQDDRHAGFASALAELGQPAEDDRVRIAHLDTGFDPRHQSLPQHLDRALQRNFVDDQAADDASDLSSGPLNNRGHGTGTLSLLAGAPAGGLPRLGAAPFARVVPIRVANRVVLFRNSAIAQALDHVHKLCDSPATAVDIVSMSMGGLASSAWADAVNALYEAGVLVVTAAGNNFGNLPTRHIVYPARFNRVIAACGAMADQTPYADLPLAKMAGNYGPASKMRTAMAACTPNVPWAKFDCADVVDLDGAGTSAATPQIAAAAAIWLQQNRGACRAYPQPWMRVEAARLALFASATASDPEKFGRGRLQAMKALGQKPAPGSALKAEPRDSASFPLFKVLTGFGFEAQATPARAMLELEALQLSQSAALEGLLPDPAIDPLTLTLARRMAIVEALRTHPRASRALRTALQALPGGAPDPQTQVLPPAPRLTRIEALHLAHALSPQPPTPAARRLRIYAYDPSLGRDLDTVGLNETLAAVRWEADLQPGPVGAYLEVVDIDPASGCCYAPVDLNDPQLLAVDGLRPSEANPQFHQQMVYAVAMRTIDHFEKALGRVALWAPRTTTARTERFVRRLRIYPHALRAENAYYSPERKALLLGYFASSTALTGAPSEYVFTALSHDIVAHETTHALLDGLHRRFREATNPDVLAFHEAFADIVALFQHFSMGDSLREAVAGARGDLFRPTLLAKLAVQFGNATGHYGALRQAIGKEIRDPTTGQNLWQPAAPPDKGDYQRSTEAHARGAVLVSAVFDAFLKIYTRRARVPIRLATHGSELLPEGALPAQLVDALTEVASKVASQILGMCIRALDYCPPVDITFGDYLRALVTADRDLIHHDPLGYRVAFVSAFAARGIYPENVRTLSVDTIAWEPPPAPFPRLEKKLAGLQLNWDLQVDRETAWKDARSNAALLHGWLVDPGVVDDDELAVLGLRRTAQARVSLVSTDGTVVPCILHGIEAHSIRPLHRVGPDGQLLSQLVIELTQSLHASDGSGMVFRGGATLLFDIGKGAITYLVRKRVDQPARVGSQQALWAARRAAQPNSYSSLTTQDAEPFALLHRAH
ncbi:S8 family serine peptidase [Variovorax sp. M-6]|uniref:S8 family serine peptidase n=1 Tax=Variovorax sp. M-6 TaxID=3233041 RepID=UPI003F9B71ED